jgi:type II secretory pathway pseudopilin PulG
MTVNRSERGYSLLELLVSTVVMLVVTGAVFTLVNPSAGTSQAQPEASDQQQRMRVAVDTLYKDLVMAAAGPYQGATTGSLVNFFAPILPYRAGQVDSDPANGVFFRDDAITIIYVPNTSAQTTIRDPMPNVSAEIKVNPQPNCPAGDDLCGFHEGMSVLIFDPTGAWESFEITHVQTSALHMQHRGQQFQKAYEAGSYIVEGQFHCYYLDSATNRLMHYDGLSSDVPVADNVVGLNFRYYGEPTPPLEPKPPIGTASCLFDDSGNSLLATLPATSGSLVELTPEMLQDGPFCGGATSGFDADLFRVRKVRVSIRTQVGSELLRGSNPTLFANPGRARGGERFIPDFRTEFEVSPRNLNLAR